MRSKMTTKPTSGRAVDINRRKVLSMLIQVGDRVQLHSFLRYRGESVPDIDKSNYTGKIIEAWGIARQHYKIKRDYDGRVYPILAHDIHSVIERRKEKKRWGK